MCGCNTRAPGNKMSTSSLGICLIVLAVLGGIVSPSSICAIIVGMHLACCNYQKTDTGCDGVLCSSFTGLVFALVQWASMVLGGLALCTDLFAAEGFDCHGDYCARLRSTGAGLIVGSSIYYPVLLVCLYLAIRRSSPRTAAAQQVGGVVGEPPV